MAKRSPKPFPAVYRAEGEDPGPLHVTARRGGKTLPDPGSKHQPHFSLWLRARAHAFVCECPDPACASDQLDEPHHDPFGADKDDRSQVLVTRRCHDIAHGKRLTPDGYTQQQFNAHLQARAAAHWRKYQEETGGP